MTVLPTRQQVDAAQPLDFDRARSERQANIVIEGVLNGLTVKVEFTGPISSIPAAIERLKGIGLGAAQHTLTPAPVAAPRPRAPKVERVEPVYLSDGTPTCPAHRKPLQESQYGGWYCAAKAKPGEEQNARGYCSLRFEE